MSDAQTKSLGPLEIKSEEKGEVEAVICTLNVVDHDREVVLPGAIKDGTTVLLSSYGHSAVFGDAPVGRGKVRVVKDQALLNAQFFMNTERGREAFETVKAIGPEGQWSIGFQPTKYGTMTKEWSEKGAERLLAAIDLFECSPVIRGASPATGTLAVKEAVKEGVKEAVQEVSAESAEKVVDAEAEAAKLAEDEAVKAAAEKAEAEAAELETKRLEAERVKSLTKDAVQEYERVQRSLKRLGVIG